MPGERPEAEPLAQLSTDYLNRFGEALMLLEMVPMDAGVLDDLKLWRAIGYRAHFETSRLRCAPSALAGYDALDPAARQAFDGLCGAMDRMIVKVTTLLDELPPEADAAAIVDVASGGLRNLIARASKFINANGAVDLAGLRAVVLQDDIDAMFAG